MLSSIKKKLVHIFYLNGVVFFEQVGFQIKARNLHRLHAQARAAGAGTDFGLHFNDFNFSHNKRLKILRKDKLGKNKPKRARNLEVRQGVGNSENTEKKAAGHGGISFAKMANLLEYCTLCLSVKSM